MELDSKQLFIKADFLFHRAKWVEDWRYIDLETVLEKRFTEILSSSFENEKVILIRGRRDSAVLNQNELHNLLSQDLCKSDFRIWNLEFTSVLEFNKIGVYRKGKIS